MPRRLRLFACACARSLQHHLCNPHAQLRAIHAAERVADGVLSGGSRQRYRRETKEVVRLHRIIRSMPSRMGLRAGEAVDACLLPHPEDAALHAAATLSPKKNGNVLASCGRIVEQLFADPERPVPAVHKTDDAVRIATLLYDKGDDELSRLGLADIQEDGGCMQAAVLLRKRKFLKGNWVIDALRGE